MCKSITREQMWIDFCEEDKKFNKGLIVNHLDEIQLIMENPYKFNAFVENELVSLLEFATLHSDFYRRYDNFKSIEDFSIVNKEILKENWDKVFVPSFSNRANNKEKFTSGSTGTPFKVVWDHRKHCRMIADIKFFAQLGGCFSHECVLCLVVEKKKHFIPMERQIKDNVFTINCSYFDDNSISQLLNEIEVHNPKLVIGYSSMWDAIANYVESYNLETSKANPSSIMAEAEYLNDRTRKIISKYFCCPVYSRYGNEECGVIAQEDGSGYGHLVNTSSYYVEILKLDSDIPAEDGEIGRVVITDLYNYAFPLIRYENGDLASKISLDDGKVYLKDLVGRKIDQLYTTDGRMVNWLRALIFMKYLEDVKQFQVIQESYTEFTWILNTKNKNYESFITKEATDVFGKDSFHKFKYVDEIPKLSSGKTKMTICNIL